MSNNRLDNNGTILVFVLIICSVMILTGAVTLSTTLMDYKMKKINSDVKKSLYQAEAAIDEAYVIILDFITSAIEYAANGDADFKTAFVDFLEGNCSDSKWGKSICDVLNNNSEYIVNNGDYPFVNAVMTESEKSFKLEITSTHMTGNVKKQVSMLCDICIPDDNDEFDINNANAADLLKVIDWKVIR